MADGPLPLKDDKVRKVCDRSIFTQKTRDVHKISARNSGSGNGFANFMGAWHFLVLSAGKPPMPIKFLLLGGGSGDF